MTHDLIRRYIEERQNVLAEEVRTLRQHGDADSEMGRRVIRDFTQKELEIQGLRREDTLRRCLGLRDIEMRRDELMLLIETVQRESVSAAPTGHREGSEAMSYREENGQVILTMSREDYNDMGPILQLRAVTSRVPENRERIKRMLNRLNSGNPNYTPYQVAAPQGKEEGQK